MDLARMELKFDISGSSVLEKFAPYYEGNGQIINYWLAGVSYQEENPGGSSKIRRGQLV